MATQKLSVGILAPLAEVPDSLSGHVEATQIGTVKIVADEYCAVEDDYPTQRFIETHPDIILVDMHDQRAAIKALFTLHGVLPETWLCACGAPNDPQLIIETMQAGAREFLPKPVSARTLAMVFSRFIDERERLRVGLKSRGKIYSVTAAKGGSGATSVAINTATVLASSKEARVAVLDLNSPVGDAAAYLNLKPSDALAAAPRLDSVLLETFMSKSGNLSILPGPRQVKSGWMQPPALAKLFRVVAGTYTHIFVDLPSSSDQDVLQVATDASEAVLVVMTPELPAVWRTHRLMTLLASAGCGDRLRLILNRDNSRDEITEKEITRALNHPIFFRLHSSLASSYRRLAQELTGVKFENPRRNFPFFLGVI